MREFEARCATTWFVFNKTPLLAGQRFSCGEEGEGWRLGPCWEAAAVQLEPLAQATGSGEGGSGGDGEECVDRT